MTLSRVWRPVGRHPYLAGTALLALGWAITLLVPPWSDESVGDLGTRSGYAELMLGGELPYRDFGFEYPPLAAPAIAVPGLAGTSDDHYRLGSAAFTFLLAAAVLILLLALARRTQGRMLPVVLATSAAPLLLGAVVRLHFDLLAVALTLSALLAILASRPGVGMGLLGLGAMTKGFPLIAAPVALAWLWAAADRRSLRNGLLGLLLPAGVVGLAWLAWSPDGAHDTFGYQLDRPIQVESSPASVLLIAEVLGAGEAASVESHGTVGLEHPLDTALQLGFGAALLAAVVGCAALAALARRSPDEDRSTPMTAVQREEAGRPPSRPVDPAAARALLLGAACALTASAAFGGVLSPQYLLWAIPLLGLAAAWRMHALALACACALLLTQLEFPSRYFELVEGEPQAVAITAARNATLIAVVALALLELKRVAGARGGGAARVTRLRGAAAAAARPTAPSHPLPPRPPRR